MFPSVMMSTKNTSFLTKPTRNKAEYAFLNKAEYAFLPSMGAIANCVGQRTDFRFTHVEDFGAHYAIRLSLWRQRFWMNLEAVKALGFDERFIRMWHYYLCYCEAGFRERQIGVKQFLLAKPRCELDFVT